MRLFVSSVTNQMDRYRFSCSQHDHRMNSPDGRKVSFIPTYRYASDDVRIRIEYLDIQWKLTFAVIIMMSHSRVRASSWQAPLSHVSDDVTLPLKFVFLPSHSPPCTTPHYTTLRLLYREGVQCPCGLSVLQRTRFAHTASCTALTCTFTTTTPPALSQHTLQCTTYCTWIL